MTRGWMPWVICALLIGAVLFFRLSATLSVPDWSDDASYRYVRYAQMTHDSGEVLSHDPLSYDGRDIVENPFLIKLLSFFYVPSHGIIGFKIIMSLIGALVPLIVFFIAREITTDLFLISATTAISGFIPLHYFLTVNSISVVGLLLPLMLFSMYAYMKYEKSIRTSWLYVSLFFWIISSAIHPFALLLPAGLLCYLFLLWLEQVEISRLQIEFAITVTICSSVINYLLSSAFMLAHGADLLHQMYLYATYVSRDQILPLLPQMGLFLLAIAAVGAYRTFFVVQRREIVFFTGFLCAALLALAFGISSAESAFLWVSLLSVLFFPIIFVDMEEYVSLTKFAQHTKWITSIFLVCILLTAIIPTYFYTASKIKDSPDPELTALLGRISEATPSSSIIIGPIPLANTIMYFTNRSTYADAQTLLIFDASSREKRINDLYGVIYQSELIDLLPALHIWKNRPAYLLYSPEFGVKRPSPHISCIQLVDQEGPYELYRVNCNA